MDSDGGGFSFLCNLAEDPALTDAVLKAGTVGALMRFIHPDAVDSILDEDKCYAGQALAAPLAATARAAEPLQQIWVASAVSLTPCHTHTGPCMCIHIHFYVEIPGFL